MRIYRFLLPVVWILLLACAARSQTPQPERIISIDVSKADFRAVVSMLESQGNITAVVRDGSAPYNPVSIHLSDTSLSKAIHIIALSAGAEVTRNADGAYMFTPAGEKAASPVVLNPKPGAAINPKDLSYRNLYLQHITPQFVLKLMHWDGAAANLPVGVARIFGLQSNSSLLVSATPDGFNRVKQIVKILDITPTQVQIEAVFASVPGNGDLFTGLHSKDAVYSPPQFAVVDSGTPAAITGGSQEPFLVGHSGIIANFTLNFTLTITPRIERDGSTITLDITPQPTDTQVLTMLRTVHSGEKACYDLGALSTDKDHARRLCVLITPTILPADFGDAVVPALDNFAPAPNQRWYKIALAHTHAPDIIQEMHWFGAASLDNRLSLPAGVERIFARHGENSLLLHATVNGFVETHNIVKILDTAGYTFAPTLTFRQIIAGDVRFKWVNGPTQSLEVTTNDKFAEIFRQLAKTEAGAKTVRFGGRYLFDPMDLVVANPRLRSDGSLTLDFTYANWNGPPVEVSGIHRGSVLAVRGKRTSQVTLVQVDY